MKYRKPDIPAVNKMLGMIAGPDAEVLPLGDVDEASLTHQGVFVNRDGATVTLCECDLIAAVGLGCSLSMIPQAGMETMLADKALSDSAASNLYEVMNILSGLFMDDHTPHLKLDRVVERGFDSVVGTPTVVCYTVCLGRYGKGQMRFHTT